MAGTAESRFPRTVKLGSFAVADATREEVVSYVSRLVGRGGFAFALHVGGLNERRRSSFMAALQEASIVYADGAAVVALARLAGATKIQRAPTTDLGIPIIRAMGDLVGRPARVAIIGGRPGVAAKAAQTVVSETGAEMVFVRHGYQLEDDGSFSGLEDASPDIVVLGLGMPLEAEWATKHRARFGQAVVLTCGGWLGFLAGGERRAPIVLQKVGMEWAHRLLASPRRLTRRYSSGAVSTVYLAARIMAHRFRRP